MPEHEQEDVRVYHHRVQAGVSDLGGARPFCSINGNLTSESTGEIGTRAAFKASDSNALSTNCLFQTSHALVK